MQINKRLFIALLAMCGMLFGMSSAVASPKEKKHSRHVHNAKIDKLKAHRARIKDLQAKKICAKKLHVCDADIGNLTAESAFIADLQTNHLTVNGDAAIHGDLVVDGNETIHGDLVVDGCVTSKCCKDTDQITPTIINVPFNLFYSTGTASQSDTIVTGVGTAFTSDMVGGRIVFNYQTAPLMSGSWANIIGFIDATHLLVDRSLEVASSTFRIGYGPYTSIQEAIDTFCTGFAGYTFIEIMPGTYDEFIDVEGFLAVANNTPRDFQNGDEQTAAGTPGFQILGDSRPFINFSYATGYEYAGTSGRGRNYVVTTDVPGVGPYNAFIASSFGAVGGVTNLGAQNAEPLFAPGVSGLACVPLTNVGITGEIAVIRRGTCGFASKTANAQAAGAAAAIIWNNNPLTGIFQMGGLDFSVTIPAYSISNADGLALSAAIAANPSITISVTPEGGIYYPPLGTNYAIAVLSHPGGDRSKVTVTMTPPLPLADDNILAPPVLEQPIFDAPSVGIVPGDYIALADADILGNYANSLHMVTAVSGNTVTIDPPVAEVMDGGVDITALGSNITFLPNVRLTKSFPYEPGQLPRAIMKVDGVDVSITGLWIDQHESQPFANVSAAFETIGNRTFISNLAVTDFFGTTANGLAYHSIDADAYLEDGYRGEAGKHLAVNGWTQGVGVSSMGMLRLGNVFVAHTNSAGSGVSIGGSIGVENFQSFGTQNLFQPGAGAALALGGGADYNGTNFEVNKLLQITDVFGRAVAMEQSQLNAANPSVRIERIYRPANGTIDGDFGAVAVGCGSLFSIHRGDYLPDGTPLTAPTLTSVFSDCFNVGVIDPDVATEPEVAIYVNAGGRFVTTGELLFNNNDLNYQTVQEAEFTAPFDPASPNDVFLVTASGDANAVFLKQAITTPGVALTLDPAEQFGIDNLYSGKTYIIRNTGAGGATLTLPGAFFKQFGVTNKTVATFTGANAYIEFLVESNTSVVVLDSAGVTFS